MTVKDLGYIDLYDYVIHVFYKTEDERYHLEFFGKKYVMELSPNEYINMFTKLKELSK